MVRLLLTVFFVGLVVSCACWGAVAALGGPDTDWGRSFIRSNGDWTFGDGSSEKWDESGVATRSLPWTGSDRLEINVPAEIDYTQGPDAKVTISGPKSLIDRITLNDGAISYKDSMGWNRGRNDEVHLTIQAPGVKRFELNGAAKMTINAYSQDSMDLEVNGAAKVNASGQANRLHMELNGASSAEMGSLLNDDASVELNGASNVTIAPRLSAKVEINGVGHASLLTHPAKVEEEKHGIGSITYDAPSSSAAPATPVQPLPLPGAAKPSQPSQPAPKSRLKATAT